MLKKITAAVVIALMVVGFSSVAMAQAMYMMADFDSGQKPNNIGGDFGAWDKDPEDKTQSCTISFFKEQEPGNYSIKISYDVDSPNPAYNGFWTKLERSDLSDYGYLVISVRGDEAAGYTDQIMLELKNNKGEVGKYLLKGITSKWNKFAIPLKDFAGLRDRSSMSEFVIVFDDIRSNKKIGTIYIDEIYAE